MKQKQSTFIVNSKEYIEYKMLQIENEIESEQIKLQNEMDKHSENVKQYNEKARVKRTNIRNRMRNIMNVDNKPLILDSIQRINDTLSNKYDHLIQLLPLTTR
eukprot:93120_1